MEPYDPEYPVVCFDERPCFLIGNRVEGLEMEPGKVAKEDYSYTKHGSCAALAAIEPLTGRRFVHVKAQRRKIEFATFMQELSNQYPNAKRIRLVLDNLNTHRYESLYDHFDAEAAYEIMRKIEFIFTPKSASWLNMIEIEFSALARNCLNRRIPSQDELEKEVQAFFKERTEKQIKIKWQFTSQAARKKLNSRYAKVNKINKNTSNLFTHCT